MGCSNKFIALLVIVLVGRMLEVPIWYSIAVAYGGYLIYSFAAPMFRRRDFSENGGGKGQDDSEEFERIRQERHRAMLAAFSGLTAKIAKADGRISEGEIHSIEAAFQRMGLDSGQREHCIRAFRQARDDPLPAQAYAAALRRASPNREVRIFLYELLWELATADGAISQAEESILGDITYPLGISASYFDYCRIRYRFFRQAGGAGGYHGGGRGGSGGSFGNGGAPRRETGSLEAAYATLGVDPSASDDEVKKSYRAAAKKYHPDILRAQGMSDELVRQAQEKMAAVNDAWTLIRKSRNTL